jgi:N6-adenosine-specific RNA methylase IME4
MSNFSLIYADPPWTYRDKACAGKRGACHKYSTLTVEQLCALPVESLAGADCLLAMWWVAPMPMEALRVVEAWGFRLKTMKGFTWHKETRHGKSHFGMGNYTRANTEDCLFAVRGRPKRVDCAVRQFISAPKGRHSEKPAEARRRLEQLLGPVRRVELFARCATPDWDIWGNEVVSTIQLPSTSSPTLDANAATATDFGDVRLVRERIASLGPLAIGSGRP